MRDHVLRPDHLADAELHFELHEAGDGADVFVPPASGLLYQLDIDGLRRDLHALLSPCLAGYALQLRRYGRVLIDDRQGAARTPRRRRRRLGPSVQMHVASVSKLITAMAMTKLLHSRNISPDATIARWLPKHWVRGPGVDRLTFRQLLTHTSGLVALDEAGARRLPVHEGSDRHRRDRRHGLSQHELQPVPHPDQHHRRAVPVRSAAGRHRRLLGPHHDPLLPALRAGERLRPRRRDLDVRPDGRPGAGVRVSGERARQGFRRPFDDERRRRLASVGRRPPRGHGVVSPARHHRRSGQRADDARSGIRPRRDEGNPLGRIYAKGGFWSFEKDPKGASSSRPTCSSCPRAWSW